MKFDPYIQVVESTTIENFTAGNQTIHSKMFYAMRIILTILSFVVVVVVVVVNVDVDVNVDVCVLRLRLGHIRSSATCTSFPIVLYRIMSTTSTYDPRNKIRNEAVTKFYLLFLLLRMVLFLLTRVHFHNLVFFRVCFPYNTGLASFLLDFFLAFAVKFIIRWVCSFLLLIAVYLFDMLYLS